MDADCQRGDSGGILNAERTCGIDPQGRQACVPACGSGNYVCVDGVSTACERADDSHCEACGCPDNLRCEPGVGCEPKHKTGEPCESDLDCNTDNCSDFSGKCRVPVGSPCDASNCDVCLAADNGWSFCSRLCGSEFDCPEGACLGGGNTFYCHPRCQDLADASCPGECRFNNDIPYYCDCVGNGCSWLEEAHPLGADCTGDGDCASGLCDAIVDRVDSLYGVLYQGICTAPCTASSECEEGFLCALADQSQCMPTCDEFCDIGYCTGLPTTEGDAQNVCWIKRPSGTCVQPTDCQSNNCVADACAPPGGQPNGAGCDGPDDCQSKSCVASTCRGLALLGDTCESSADCAVGMCCTTGDLPNTCNNACN